MKEYAFEVSVDEDALDAFADLSGDHNPLHTNAAYAAGTPYRRRVLHGAYAAGLVSRMAGMHLPGEACLLHDMRLKFVSPMVPPLTLRVEGRVDRQSGDGGQVSVVITGAADGRRYVEARYAFGYHGAGRAAPASGSETRPANTEDATSQVVLISGASGGLGTALSNRLGAVAVPVSRADEVHTASGRARLLERLGDASVRAVVHCGWPAQDNCGLLALPDPAAALETGLVEPLSQGISLASIMVERGGPGATLVLIGSTAASRGRHFWRAPLYSMGKAVVPTLTEVLAMELSAQDMRCLSVRFDALDGGMNAQQSAAARVANMDRSPWGRLMSLDEAADSVNWVLDNPSRFMSGATFDLSGGAAP